MPSNFLEPTDPGAFTDWPLKSPDAVYGYTKLCTRCQGHGGWNLTPNAYRMPAGYADTPENRHLYVHFRTMCDHCNGWGYTHPSVTCPGHSWKFAENLGRCYNRYKCIHCGATQDWDSSD